MEVLSTGRELKYRTEKARKL